MATTVQERQERIERDLQAIMDNRDEWMTAYNKVNDRWHWPESIFGFIAGFLFMMILIIAFHN